MPASVAHQEDVKDRIGCSSGEKMSSMRHPKTPASLNASPRLGSKRPLSIEMMVWRVTPTRAARSDWDHRRVRAYVKCILQPVPSHFS